MTKQAPRYCECEDPFWKVYCTRCGYHERPVVSRPSNPELSPSERLRRIVSFLEEQANESPFTREEWERVDKQTAEKNREIERLRADNLLLLNKFAQHADGCPAWDDCDEGNSCTCGLAKLERSAHETIGEQK